MKLIVKLVSWFILFLTSLQQQEQLQQSLVFKISICVWIVTCAMSATWGKWQRYAFSLSVDVSFSQLALHTWVSAFTQCNILTCQTTNAGSTGSSSVQLLLYNLSICCHLAWVLRQYPVDMHFTSFCDKEETLTLWIDIWRVDRAKVSTALDADGTIPCALTFISAY